MLFSVFAVWASIAWANELANFPGWRVEEIRKEVAEGELNSGPVFFSLKPPNGRDAITIERKDAMALIGGALDPESLYKQRTAGGGDSKSKEGEPLGGSAQFVAAGEESQSTKQGEHSDGGGSYQSRERIAASFASSSVEASSFPANVAPTSQAGSEFPTTPTALPKLDSGKFPATRSSVSAVPVAASVVPSHPADLKVPVGLPATADQPSASATILATNSASRGGEADFKPSNPTRADIYSGSVSQSSEIQESSERKQHNRKPSSTESYRTEDRKFDKLPEYYDCQQKRENLGTPTVQRIRVSKGCRMVLVQAWGAGGGGSRGGAGAWVTAGGKVDFAKYDLIAVVGSPGAKREAGSSGGAGGKSSASVGYGGGGFSGLFLVEKSSSSNEINPRKALAISGGGGGESGSGTPGGGGRSNGSLSSVSLEGSPGGDGQAYPGCPNTGTCSIADPSQTSESGNIGTITVNWDHESAGGGGGGGGAEPGSGGSGSAAGGLAGGGEGGGSVHRMENGQIEGASGSKPALEYYQDRQGAGAPGKAGRVILDIY